MTPGDPTSFLELLPPTLTSFTSMRMTNTKIESRKRIQKRVIFKTRLIGVCVAVLLDGELCSVQIPKPHPLPRGFKDFSKFKVLNLSLIK